MSQATCALGIVSTCVALEFDTRTAIRAIATKELASLPWLVVPPPAGSLIRRRLLFNGRRCRKRRLVNGRDDLAEQHLDRFLRYHARRGRPAQGWRNRHRQAPGYDKRFAATPSGDLKIGSTQLRVIDQIKRAGGIWMGHGFKRPMRPKTITLLLLNAQDFNQVNLNKLKDLPHPAQETTGRLFSSF